MSYFMHKYIPLKAGTPGWQFAPVPSWGVNPDNAGPRRVGMGALGCGGGCGQGAGATAEEQYKTVSWGHVAGGAAGALIVGLLVGYAAGKSAKEKKRGRYRSNIWNA